MFVGVWVCVGGVGGSGMCRLLSSWCRECVCVGDRVEMKRMGMVLCRVVGEVR